MEADQASVLSAVLTPSSEHVPDDEPVAFATLDFPIAVPDSVKDTWPPNVQPDLSIAFVEASFLSAFTLGSPRQVPAGVLPVQFAATYGALLFYSNAVEFYIGLLPTAAQGFIQKVLAVIQGKASVDDFQQEAEEFYGIGQAALDLVNGVDSNAGAIPPDPAIPELMPLVQETANCVTALMEAGNEVVTSGGAAAAQSGAAGALQQLQGACQQVLQGIAALKQKIGSSFGPYFSEPPYAEFHQYASQFMFAVSQFLVIGYQVGLRDPAGVPAFYDNLKKAVESAFAMMTPILALLRFRGNLEAGINKGKAGHQAFGPLFQPIVQVFVALLPKCPIALQAKGNEVLSGLIGQIQTLWGE